jgi:hypothetical protein
MNSSSSGLVRLRARQAIPMAFFPIRIPGCVSIGLELEPNRLSGVLGKIAFSGYWKPCLTREQNDRLNDRVLPDQIIMTVPESCRDLLAFFDLEGNLVGLSPRLAARFGWVG